MVLFRNLGVKPWDCLCDAQNGHSAQSLELLDLAEISHLWIENSGVCFTAGA
jgi:hypothetical protein